jgi:hypothetical protein
MKNVPNQPLGFADFIRAAFGWRYQVPALGRVRLNLFGLAGFTILGLGHPAFWLLGLAFETGYLLFMSGNERFQKVVQGMHLSKQQDEWGSKLREILKSLDNPSRARYGRITELCDGIFKSSAVDGTGADSMRYRSLSQLVWTFLQLQVSKMRINSILSQVTRAQLIKELDGISGRLTTEKPETQLYRSLTGTKEIAQKRLENYDRAAENLLVVDSELDRIEKQFMLLHEEASVSSPELLTTRLDGVIQSLQDTSRWLTENRELLGSVDEAAAPEIMPGLLSQVQE